jgi:site-specific recombinase XerC
MTLIAPTLQAFFSERLLKQRNVSPRTIASYRDTLRLLLCFVHETTGRAPSELEWDELDEPVIAAFLQHSSTNGTTPRGPATCGSPRSDPCSATPPCATPSTQQ